MSIPVSLRLCCVAAMAPALTESTSQPRVQLPGSPPPVVSNGILRENNTVDQETPKDFASVKSKLSRSLSSELQNTARSLLKPLEGHIDSSQTSLSEKVTSSWQTLGLPSNFTDILKQLSAVKSEGSHNKDKQTPNNRIQKMNQPSPPIQNGSNETNSLKQTCTVSDSAVNGHSKGHSDLTKRLSYGHLSSQRSAHNHSKSSFCSDSDTKMCVTSGTNTSQQGQAVPSTSETTGDSVRQTSVSKTIHSLKHEDRAFGQGDVKPVDLKEVSRKEYLLERRGQFLLRRLRRLQGKHLETQVKLQLKSYVDFQHQNLQSAASKAIRPFGNLPNTLFNSHDVKNLSTSNLVSLVRKLQASQPKQAVESNSRRGDARRSVLVMEQSVSSETERKSGHLRRDLRHWSDVADSDATESSSGGESCEEWEDCPLMSDNKVPTPLYKRAEWKWSVERAAIVARWTWLQAQVSDLEYRIRQQSEIFKTIRSSKGVVTLCEAPLSLGPGGDASNSRLLESSPATVASLMINVNKQASRLSHSLGNCLSPNTGSASEKFNSKDGKPLNGVVDRSHSGCTPLATAGSIATDSGSSNVSPLLGQPLDISCVAARCRPVRFYRKRKLLHTSGLHQVSHKAARLSSVQCACYPPVMPCPMCGGRYNNTQKLDAECMPIMEKVSLLDPSFHPVLSFPQEIGLPLHFEALLKSGEWQSSKSQPKITHRALAAEKRRQRLLNEQLKEQARKNKRKYKKSASAMLLTSAKLRSKYDAKSPHKKARRLTAESRLPRTEMRRRKSAPVPSDGDFDSQVPSPQMRDGTLSHSASSSTLKEIKETRRRRFENAYDINNIVIPYSMAASTRVEKLKYKEIQTPEWREVAQGEKDVGEMSDQGEVEDLTDETFSQRHDALEIEERKRIRNYITYPPVRRSRMSRESESNTLDTFSPESSLNEASFASEGVGLILGEERRRSGSTSRRAGYFDDYLRDYDSEEGMCFEPWPERQFPLAEETYEQMKLEQSKVGPTRNTYRRPRTVKVQDDPSMEFISPEGFEQEDSSVMPGFPYPSEGSMSNDDEDDPEWNETHGDRRSSISMKHSKR